MPAGDSGTARAYWNAAAGTYDQDFAGTLIGLTRREAVWRDLDRIVHPGQRILELNCGTGIDALHLAERGVRIVACDIAPRMIDLARQRVSTTKFAETIEFRALPTEEIGTLATEEPFDGAFSNFAGLNCVEDLSATSRDLRELLKPGASLLLCMIGRFVPWEILWFLAHSDPVRAVQRLRSGTSRAVEGGQLKVQYPSVRDIARVFAPSFRLRKWRGIGVTVPPSYVEHWASRFPRTTRALAAVDDRLGDLPVFRNMADAVLLTFERTERR